MKMKYVTKRQRKRKKVQLLNRIGQTSYSSDTDSENSKLDKGINLATVKGANNKKLRQTTSPPIKVIAKVGLRQQQQQPQQQQQQPQQQQYQQYQQQQQHQLGTTTSHDIRRSPFCFGAFNIPPIDHDLDCYYHRNVPLTLGNFMDLKQLNERFENRVKTTISTPESSPTISLTSSDLLDIGSDTDLSMLSSSNTSTESIQDFTDTSSSEAQVVEERVAQESVNQLLTRFAINTPYTELANLTLTMLQNTAFGPLATGSPSTANNIPSYEFWPNPYQINYQTNDEPSDVADAATATATVADADIGAVAVAIANDDADAMPGCSVKPIGYEARFNYQEQSWDDQQQYQQQQATTSIGSGIDMWQPWLHHHQQCNPNSIVESIKSIWKSNPQSNDISDNWSNWGNNKSGSIWSVTEPQLQLQQQQQQQQQLPMPESSWDQRSQTVLAASQLYGFYMPTVLLESSQPGQQLPVTATSNHFMRSNSHSLRCMNRNIMNYNYPVGSNRLQSYQQQQQLQLKSQQKQQQQQQQLQHLRYNYSNQQQQQQQQQQHQQWQWQLYKQSKPRPHFYTGRNNKANTYNNSIGGNNNNSNAARKYCNARSASSNTNSINNNNNNMDVSTLNMSQEDLDATQLYAIHGESFFEMPMGRRYRRTLYPSKTATISQAAATPTPQQSSQPAMPAAAAAAATAAASSSGNDVYASNGHFSTWQTTPMLLYSMQAAKKPSLTTATSSQTLQNQMTAPICTDSNLYTANFPPLPAPSQKRQKE